MGWLLDLGGQIQKARKSAKMSQEGLAAKVSARFPISRAQISHYESGLSAPAVNIVTEIAEALGTEFVVGGCRIGKRTEQVAGPLTIMPRQLNFEFDVEHKFDSATLKLTSMPEDSISLQAIFTHERGGRRLVVR